MVELWSHMDEHNAWRGVQRAVVQTEIVGLAAATRVELVLFNPNAIELQAELQFPLLEGQTVSGFALDIGGQLRAAVPVEKAKGRQVFEDVVRARVDPALLEATQGGHHKLQVYPLPPRGQRRVVLEIQEALPASAQPVWRVAMTSLWSPKIDRPCAASERAATWNTVEVSSPAILYIFGIISSRPCDAVKVVVSEPAWSEPCTAPAAPASLCISTTRGTVPHRFG